MTDSLVRALTEIQIEASEWRFIDLRIDIPAQSFGSDAINPHTQYSNPIALMEHDGSTVIGASFTLGAGNEMVCKGAEYIVGEFNGCSVGDLISSKQGFYETLSNPLQLRWLSPNAGVPLMASGLVVNTLLDAASKKAGLPAWEYLARMPSDILMELISLRHLDERFNPARIREVLDRGLDEVEERCTLLKAEGLPVYYTTWLGHDAQTISQQILVQYEERGIRTFKIKISPDIEHDRIKLEKIRELIPPDVELCVDANQTLDLEKAQAWLALLSDQGVKWLEEPFAPDNIRLFNDLIRFKRMNKLSCEVVTGENCPNHFTAAALMDCGIDRFQADPCRMLGLIDDLLICIISSIQGCEVTPHAGGSSLDEMSPHIQLFNLARIRTDLAPADSLTENVGFCSQYFKAPTVVEKGRAKTQTIPGMLVGVTDNVMSQLRDYNEGVTWLKL